MVERLVANEKVVGSSPIARSININMIIWIASYPKSGNTWVRSFLSSLLYSKDGIADLNSIRISQYPLRSHFKGLTSEFENINFFQTDFKSHHKGVKGLMRLLRELIKLKPTHIADLHSVLRTHFLTFFFKILLYRVKKLDKLRLQKQKLFRKTNKVLKPLTPTQFRYAEVFCRLGFNIDLTNHHFPLPKTLSLESKNFISSIDSRKNRIGIAPFASYVGKIYPLDLMQKVVAYLQQENHVFLFGNGDYETNILKIWENAYPNVSGCYKLESLEKELEIISNLSVMVSMDSANGHIAANYNIPVVLLWLSLIHI